MESSLSRESRCPRRLQDQHAVSKLLSSGALMSELFIRRVSLYARAALIASLALVIANVIYGVSRYHREPVRVEVLLHAAFHSFALTLLPALALSALAALAVSLAAPLIKESLLGRLLRAPLLKTDPELSARALSALIALSLFAAGAQQLGHHFATRYHNATLASLALAASVTALGIACVK